MKSIQIEVLWHIAYAQSEKQLVIDSWINAIHLQSRKQYCKISNKIKQKTFVRRKYSANPG